MWRLSGNRYQSDEVVQYCGFKVMDALRALKRMASGTCSKHSVMAGITVVT